MHALYPRRQGQEKRLSHDPVFYRNDQTSRRRSATSAGGAPAGTPPKKALSARRFIALIVAVLAISGVAATAQATVVSGILVAPDGRPISDRQVHFENRITRVLYLMRTDSDGKFAADLPPGTYDLRRAKGPIIRAGIKVENVNDDLGKVAESSVDFWSSLFELEALAERIVNSPAPSTANLPPGGMSAPPAGMGVPASVAPAASPPSPAVSSR